MQLPGAASRRGDYDIAICTVGETDGGVGSNVSARRAISRFKLIL